MLKFFGQWDCVSSNKQLHFGANSDYAADARIFLKKEFLSLRG